MSDSTAAAIKKEIRNRLRKARVEYAASLPAEVSALVFHRPPHAVLEMIPDDAVIGFYRADPGEAPANSYAKFFLERGHTIALPWLVNLQTPMIFRRHTDPYGESDLARGYFNLMQSSEDAPEVVPDVLFMPLVAFTPHGHRLGQGGGFYDKWLGAHPDTIRFGLAWDMQEVPELPNEWHDMPLTGVITPTRLLGPF